jgi:flagellar hook-associated protein 3 FlgL
MSIRLSFAGIENQILPRLQSITSQLSTAQQQLSNGQRIVNPSDDPAAMARVMNARTDAAQTAQYYQNSQTALEIGQAGTASLQDIESVGSRTDELAAQTTAVSGPEEFTANASEITQLIEQGVNAANGKWNGNYLMSGTSTQTQPFSVTRDATGKITNVAYDGAASAAGIPVSDSETVSPSTTGAENQQIADYLNQMIAMRDAMASGDPTAVANARPDLQTSENNVLNTISRTGGVQAQLTSAADDAQTHYTSAEGVISKNADVDYAQASVRLTQANTAYQAALQSAALLQQHSLLDYLH